MNKALKRLTSVPKGSHWVSQYEAMSCTCCRASLSWNRTPISWVAGRWGGGGSHEQALTLGRRRLARAGQIIRGAASHWVGFRPGHNSMRESECKMGPTADTMSMSEGIGGLGLLLRGFRVSDIFLDVRFSAAVSFSLLIPLFLPPLPLSLSCSYPSSVTPKYRRRLLLATNAISFWMWIWLLLGEYYFQ